MAAIDRLKLADVIGRRCLCATIIKKNWRDVHVAKKGPQNRFLFSLKLLYVRRSDRML